MVAKRLEFSSMFVFCLVASSIAQWGCTSAPKEKEAWYLARGKARLDKQEYDKAVLEFRNALKLAPRDAEVYYQLGSAFLMQKNLRSAAAAWRKATELNPNHTEAQIKLAKLMALRGDDDSAKLTMNRVQDIVAASPDNPDALDALALAELRFGDRREGEQHLREAISRFPQHLQSPMLLAKLKLDVQDFDGAGEVLKDAVQHNPQSREAKLALATSYSLRGRLAEAQVELRNILKSEPRDVVALDALASVELRAGHKDDAEQTYRQIAALPDLRYKHHHAAYLFREGQRDAAIAEFAQLAKEDPQNRDARSRLVTANLLAGRVDEAQKILSSALRSNPKDADALLERARILLGAGKPEQARADLLKVLQFQPNEPMAHYLLAKVHQAQGETQLQREELDKGLQLQPNLLFIRIELAQANLAANQAKAALGVIEATPESQKDLLPYIVQRNWDLLAAGDFTELDAGIKRGFELGGTPDIFLQAGLREIQRRNYSAARSNLIKVLDSNPADLRSLEALARTYAEEGQVAIAYQKLKEYAARSPKSSQVQSYLGEQLEIRGDVSEARKAFMSAKAADPTDSHASLALAQLDLREGHLEQARKGVLAVLASGRDGLPARLMLGDIETKAGNYSTAIEHYRKALEVNPRSVRALNDLAYLLVEHQNQPDQALKYAQTAAEILPEDPAVKDTIGWVYYHKGVYLTAAQFLKSAAEKPDMIIAKYHLGMTYMKAGERGLGRQALEAALKTNPNLPEAQAARELLKTVGAAK